MSQFLHSHAASAWAVFLLFAIPFGPGIPGGVLLAKAKQIGWVEMSVLYFVSDVCLACVFEPLLRLMIVAGRRNAFLGRMVASLRAYMAQSQARYGSATGPLALIGVSFIIDPMTGRSLAAAAGHGPISGWLIAITGDMFYFWVIMIATLALGQALGGGSVATGVTLAIMIIAPILFSRWRDKRAARQAAALPSPQQPG